MMQQTLGNTKQSGMYAIEVFREAMNKLRRYNEHISTVIGADPDLTEQDRQQRLESIIQMNRTLDEWEVQLKGLTKERMTREQQLALIISAKRLRAGIEEW